MIVDFARRISAHCLFFLFSFFSLPGWPWLASHGLGDKWAPRRRLSCDQSGVKRPWKHSEGSPSEGSRLERGREHKDPWANIRQHGSAEKLRSRDTPSFPPHHLAGLSNWLIYRTPRSCCCLLAGYTFDWNHECNSCVFTCRFSANWSVEMQSQPQSRRRKICFHPQKEKTRSVANLFW